MRRLLAYPFVVLYFILSLAQLPIHFLLRLCTRTAALIQTGDAETAFMPRWMLLILAKLEIIHNVKTVRKPAAPIVMAHIYCEAQGPSTGMQDHLIGSAQVLPPLIDCIEFGDADTFGGRHLVHLGQLVLCPRCKAPLRRFEIPA